MSWRLLRANCLSSETEGSWDRSSASVGANGGSGPSSSLLAGTVTKTDFVFLRPHSPQRPPQGEVNDPAGFLSDELPETLARVIVRSRLCPLRTKPISIASFANAGSRRRR